MKMNRLAIIAGIGVIIIITGMASTAAKEVDCRFCENGRTDCILCVDGKADCGACVDGRTDCIFCVGGVCGVCNGAGGETCILCGGTGELLGETCVGCDGDGWGECFGCGGTGECAYCAGLGHETCTLCDGKGWNTCTFCDGKGWELCVICGGTGTIEVEEISVIIGGIVLAAIAWFIIAILICVWVYRDAKARGENAALWLIIVLITGIIGLIIWLIVRPKKKVATS